MSVRSGLTRLRNSFRRKTGRVSEVTKKNGVSPAVSPKISRSAMSSPKTGRSAEQSARTGDLVETMAIDVKGRRRSDDWESPQVSRRSHSVPGHSIFSDSSTTHKFLHHNTFSAHNDASHTTSLHGSSNPNSSTSLMSSSSSSLTMTNRRSKSGSVVETVENDPEDDEVLPERRSPPATVDSDDSYENLPFKDACDAVNLMDTTHDVSFKDASMLDTTQDVSFKDAEEGGLASDADGDGDGGEDVRTYSVTPGNDVAVKSGSFNPNRVSFGTNLQEVLGRAEEAGTLQDSRRSEVAADPSRNVGNSDFGRSGRGSTTDPSKTTSSIAAATCVIPQSLKQSPSASLLGLHRDPTDDIVCRVCSQRFVKPRILPCLHTFCAACIGSLKTYPVNAPEDSPATPKRANSEDSRDSPSPEQGSSSSTSSFSQMSGGSQKSSDDSTKNEDDRTKCDGKRVVLCPICLKETRVSHTLEELPRNFVAERRVAQDVFLQEGRGIRLECDSCAELSDAAVVTVRCMDCAENLCSLCELSHRRQKKTKRHQLIDVMSKCSPPDNHHRSRRKTNLSRQSTAGTKSEALVALTVAPPRSIHCNRHPDEELKLFCITCDVPVCRDCVVVEHRDHDCQFLCQELFRHQMNDVQQMIRSVVPRITSVDHQLKRVADSQAAIQARADDVTRDINGHMDTYLSAIQRHRQHLLRQVMAVVEEKQHALHVTERHLRHVRSDVEQTCRFVSDMIENASDVEILSVKQLVTDRLTGLKELTTTQHQPVSAFIKFCPAEKGEVINNFQMFGRVISRKASAAASVLFTEGLSTARVGHESSVVLRVNGDDGAHYNEKDVKVKAWLIFQNQSIRSIPVSLSLQKNGTHCLKFSPLQPGSHFLHVAVDSQPVKDSPFKFKVKPQWREHRGVWYCCTSCSCSGRVDVPCGCRGTMPGGLSQGCAHGQPGHPGGYHWSCCGKMVQTSECAGIPMPRQSPVRQVTL